MTFDMATFDTLTQAEEGVAMPILNLRTRVPQVDEDGTPITITLLGRQSERFREVLKTIQTRRGELRHRGQETEAETREREDIEILIACTRDWSFRLLDGQAFPATPVNIRKFWNDNRFRPLRESAIAFVLADANFLPEISTGSADTPAISSLSSAHSRRVAPLPTRSEAIA